MEKTKKFLKNPIKGTKYAIMVSSAKGGVGKSTFAINLAYSLQNLGKKIGLLDADVYGPSLTKLIGRNEKPKSEDGKFLHPIEHHGLQCISMGFLIEENTPMIWRGPMVISAIKTLVEKVLWKDLDFLIIDMPPGTGDTQLTFAQDFKIDGAIIISTSQELALLDVKKGIEMFEKTEVKVIGLINNMSYFKSDDGKMHYIFGKDGVEQLSNRYSKEFLGEIPLNQDLRVSCDNGEPLTLLNSEHEISKIFNIFSKKIIEKFK